MSKDGSAFEVKSALLFPGLICYILDIPGTAVCGTVPHREASRFPAIFCCVMMAQPSLHLLRCTTAHGVCMCLRHGYTSADYGITI